MTFSLVRRPQEPRTLRARVAAVEQVTPRCRRIVLSGSELDAVRPADTVRVHLRDDVWREYTPIPGEEDGTLALEIVVHGDGVASDWVELVQPGAEVDLSVSGESSSIEGAPDWWLLIGDETALPAIRRHLAAVAPGTVVRVIVSIADAAAEQPLESPGELEARWVLTPADVPSGSVAALVDALVEVTPLLGTESGDGFAFVAGEESLVKPAEEVLLGEWGLPPEHAVIRSHWKRGQAAHHSPH